MPEPIYYNENLEPSLVEFDRFFKQLAASRNFLYLTPQIFEPPLNSDVLVVVSIEKNLKPEKITFEPVDFLKFLQGKKDVGEPWKYFMALGGLTRIFTMPETKSIYFEKMPEVSFRQILDGLKPQIEFNKRFLLED